ncbi:MAG: hypothetical protein LH603_08545 [Pseudonocardia sp.]|nr:hypothetical protein [Pseudonocardia sp.]
MTKDTAGSAANRDCVGVVTREAARQASKKAAAASQLDKINYSGYFTCAPFQTKGIYVRPLEGAYVASVKGSTTCVISAGVGG